MVRTDTNYLPADRFGAVLIKIKMKGDNTVSCYHPLRAIVFGKNPENGKKIMKIIKGEYDPERDSNPNLKYPIIPLPCGRCIGCRLDYSRTWADRCLVESLNHDSNLFLTLTYDDEHLPAKRENSPIHSLEPRELQLFMKRLRKRFSEQRIRFFACGEYGEKSMRPHYHLILFGLRLDDLRLLRRSELGQPYYTSQAISELWTYGYHIIGNCTWNTCAYVSRYMLKKQKGYNADVYENLNYEPEFCRMSRRPGIGSVFYEERNDELYSYGNMFISTDSGAKSIFPNRYSDSIFLKEYGQEILDDIKKDRADIALNRNIVINHLTDTAQDVTMCNREELHASKLRNLERSKKL